VKKEAMVKTKLWMPLILIAIFGFSGPVMADTDSKELQTLTKEIRALTAEVAELQKSVASLQRLRPTLTALMPDFAERFHVMHYAGEAGDWAVAGHELLALKGLIDVGKQVDPEKGPMLDGFMTASFNKINAAIEHGDVASFVTALDEGVKSCNACHVAVGSAFIKVTLEGRDALSLRHPHALDPSKMPGKHMHKH
jgi:hypothetical protein